MSNNIQERVRETTYYDELFVNLYSSVQNWHSGLCITISGYNGHNEHGPAFFYNNNERVEYALGTTSRFVDKRKFNQELQVFKATRMCQFKVWSYNEQK